MKKIFPAAFILLMATLAPSFSATLIEPEQFATISPELQSGIIFEQTTGTGSANIRYVSASGHYAAFQTFSWSGDYGMTGLGVKLVANNNNVNSSSPYSYYLRILSVSSVEAGAAVTEILGEYLFELTGDYRAVNDYLYFHLPTTLSLSNGGSYAFEIVSAGTQSSRLTLATAQGGSSDYPGGFGFSASGSLALPDNGAPSTISGTNINGYVFFATAAIPETGTTLLLLFGFGISLVACRRWRPEIPVA